MSPSGSPPLARAPCSARAKHRMVLVAAAVLAASLGYAWTLRGYFQGDDFGFVGRYALHPFAEFPRLFVSGWADGLWSSSLRELRPLNALAFMVDARLWGLDPLGFRMTNLLLHAGCALLVGLIASSASGRDPATGVIATVLFALHPVNAHAVAWITGRVDLLSTLALLAGFCIFLAYRERPQPAMLGLLALAHAAALFTKESGVILPLLLFAADTLWLRSTLRLRDRRTWLPYLVCAVTIIPYLACRWFAFGSGHPGEIGRGVPDLASATTWLEFVRREAAYVAHLIPPLQRWIVGWRDAGVPGPTALLLQVTALTLGVTLATQLFRRWHVRVATAGNGRAAVGFFALVWFLVATVPLMVTYFTARHLYFASAGLCIAVALLLRSALPATMSRWSSALALGLLLLVQLWQTLHPWHRSAELSRAIAREALVATGRVPPDGALFFAVPALCDGAFCWSWALPHALRPPFVASDVTARIPMLQSPETYAFSAAWRRPELFATLRQISGDCQLVEVTASGEVRLRTLPSAAVRAAARELPSGRSTEADSAHWQRFLAALRAP